MDALKPGRYVVAVSGGVDSMVLLDKLRRQPGLTLLVANADHAQRADSFLDTAMVSQYCQQHNLQLRTEKLHLPPQASEEASRKARWDFLRRCSKDFNANAIITAHHQDDLVETAIIALMRGTGWRGLAPFMPTPGLLRPLLAATKDSLIGYARRHNVPWREDSTNANQAYLRNYVRHTLIPMLDQKSATWRETFLHSIRKQQQNRAAIETAISTLLPRAANFTAGISTVSLQRHFLVMAPRLVAYECLQHVFRITTGNSLERPLAESALLFVKVARPGKAMQLGSHWQLRAESANVVVEPRPGVVSLDKY